MENIILSTSIHRVTEYSSRQLLLKDLDKSEPFENNVTKLLKPHLEKAEEFLVQPSPGRILAPTVHNKPFPILCLIGNRRCFALEDNRVNKLLNLNPGLLMIPYSPMHTFAGIAYVLESDNKLGFYLPILDDAAKMSAQVFSLACLLVYQRKSK